MKKYVYIIFIAIAGMVISSCETDIEQVNVSSNPVAPELLDIPLSIVLERDNSADTLIFEATKADFGFQAAVTYYLEAAVAGTNFAEPVEIASQELETTFKLTVGNFNSILIQTIPEDETTNMEMRIRATVNSSDLEVISDIKQVDVKTYGPPALYITGDADKQRLVSENNDGVYSGFIYTDGSGFTLTNTDDGKVYGLTSGEITENGDPIILAAGGQNVTVNLNNNTLDNEAENWGIIGSAIPPYDWSSDVDMTYDIAQEIWIVTGDFVAGEFKFRANDGWDVNLGDDNTDGSLEPGGANIPLAANGNYTITLDTNSKTYIVTKN